MASSSSTFVEKMLWADQSFQSDSEEETGEEVIEEELKYRKSNEGAECFCKVPVNVTDISSILSKENALLITSHNSQCHIHNIESCVNFVLGVEGGEGTTWARLLLADMFYRYRHEILATAVLKTLKLPITATDMPFSQFGIDSNRTPDCIVERGGVHHIFEFTATANEDKAAQMKGIASAGFESKYQREINDMRSLGFKVEYFVLVFDMNDIENSSAWDVIKQLTQWFVIDEQSLMVLRSLSRELSRITKITKSLFLLSAGLLFSPVFEVKKAHDNLKFCYVEEDYVNTCVYKDFNVSVPVYQKISSMWHRLYSMKDRQSDPGLKVMPLLEVSENRIKFINDNRGVDDDYINGLLKNNDRQGFLEILWLRVGNKLTRAIDSETGVRFTKKVKRELASNFEPIPESIDHVGTPVDEGFNVAIMNRYYKIIETQRNQLYSPSYIIENYEDKLLASMCDFDERCTIGNDIETFNLLEGAPKTLAHHDTSLIDVDALMDGMLTDLKNENSFDCSIPVKSRKMKASFLLPMASVSNKDRCRLEVKSTEFIEAVANENIGDYTKAILLQTVKEDYKFYESSPPPSKKLNEVYNERYELSTKITRIVKMCMRRSEGEGRLKFEKSNLSGDELTEYLKLTNSVSGINKLARRMEKEEGVRKNIGMLRLKTTPKTVLGQAFRNEMGHFKDKSKQSAYEGVGLSDNIGLMETRLNDEYDNIMEAMVMNCGENDDFLIDLNTYEEVKILKDLKTHTLETYKTLINQAKDSMLGHSAAFVSRYAHSLTFYSQLPFNNSYVRVDNLGYKNVLLVVRGGSKIFKTKNSKLHRLVFPVNKNILGQYVDQSYGPGSFKHITVKGSDYIVTPWILLNESILLDAISFYPRVMSFCVLNMDNEKSFKTQLHKVFINVLLAFHNRRQTESMLANLRYILLSTMGDYSAFQDIFPEFVGFNYDKVQAFLRLKLIKNYPKYFKTMRKIQTTKNFNPVELERLDLCNLFTAYPLYNTEDVALMIYSTFLMTKAPYQKSVERAANLKGIIEIHKLFEVQVGLDLTPQEQLSKISVVNTGDYLSYSQSLIKSDFKLDPYYCTNVGIFADSYFNQHVGRDDILMEWVKTLNKNWDSMATTTGLRGMSESNFFGQKGFFVIYDHVLNKKDYKEKLKFVLNSEVSEDEKRKMLRGLNLTYGSELNKTPDCLIYHAVDKRQWRGGREIYVMDMETKRMQQPIEKFMAYLCKKTDTELISIPSDKRSQVIHHALFEKDLPDKDFQQWFLTLDCSKWAPKSMFIKFALMIIPMTSIPGSFKTHFLNYLSLLYSKKLYFNESEVGILKNNPKNSQDVEGYLISDKKVKGYYMIQPYSWVMGIFNYTSSLMHAFNQKYCSYLLRESTLQSFNDDCTLFMFAHSDDSGGRISVSGKSALVRALFYYEVNLKACNHILSKKKCVVSKIYFEVLSIIYMFSQLLALLPKFLGGIRFLPTDKGPAHDMLQTYSKGIEVMVAGADFNKAYLYQKFYSAEIWRFYYNTRPNKNDYLRPPQYLGMPDAHPLMVLLNGSDSDIIRIISSGNMEHIIMLYRLFRYIDLFDSDEGLIKSLKFIVKVRGVKRGFEESIEIYKEIIKKWSLSNVNYKNTGMDSLAFLKRLSDPGFTGSLVNETEARRMSRAYFFKSGESINTKIGIKSLKEVYQLISEVHLLFSKNQDTLFQRFFGEEAVRDFMSEINPGSDSNQTLITYFKDVYSNSLKLCEYFDKMDFTPDKLKKSIRTLKPTHIQIVKFGKGMGSDFDPTQLVSSIFDPEIAWALPNPSNLASAKEDFSSLIKHLGIDQDQIDASTALKLVRTHQNKSVKEIYMYSCIPGYLRMIKNFAGIITFLSTNSYNSYEIQGMSLKLRENLTSSPIGALDIDEAAYYINTLMDVICTLGQNVDLKEIRFNRLDVIGFTGGDIEDLIKCMQSRRFSDDNYSFYNHYVEYLNNKCLLWFSRNTGKIFDDGAYYTYIKEQKFRGVWYGKGVLGLYYCNSWLVLEIHNNKVIKAQGSIYDKVDRRFASFISDTLFTNNLDSGFNDNISKNYIEKTKLYIGFDLSGDVSIDNNLNMRSGIPYTVHGYDHPFVQDIRSSEVEQVKSNLFISKTVSGKSYKIYTLKVERAEVIPILKTAIDPASVENYLLCNGYDSFLDFISQGILSSYGAEYYITLKDLAEGYMGSSLYKLFTDTQRLDQSHLPTRLETAKLPAPKGSLLRMMINYQDIEGVEILKQPKELNPSIMSVRNEFPESFSVILSEQMEKNFDKIYDDSDQLQMMDEFVKAANNEDTDKVRSACIKLMCHWGYSGLVNVLQTYVFNRDEKNYQIFSIDNTTLANKTVFLELFKKLFWAIRSALLEVYDMNKNYDWPLLDQKPTNLVKMLDQYIIDTVYSSYNFKMYAHHIPLSLIRFNNLLMAMLKEPTFVKVLNKNLENDYPLNTLDISPRCSKELIATLNTLRGVWMKSKGESSNVEFEYHRSYQHFPHTVVNPLSLINELLPLKLKSGRAKYHFFLNDSLRHEFERPEIHTQIKGQRCIIKQEILKNLESTTVPTNEVFAFEGVLTEDYMETDDYSDIMYELDSVNPDIELIESTCECEFDGDKYIETTIKKRGNSIVVPVKILYLPYVETAQNLAKYMNNAAENLVVYSTNIIHKFWETRHWRVYVIDRNPAGELPDMVAHVMSVKSIPGAFWDKYIGGRRISNPRHLIDMTYSNRLRWTDEIRESSNLGELIGEDPIKGGGGEVEVVATEDELDPWLKLGLKKADAQVCLNRKKERQELMVDIRSSISDYVASGLIDNKTADKMFKKYQSALSKKLNIGASSILESFLTEVELLTINKGIITGQIGAEVTATEQIKMMQAPESFGTAYLHSKPDNKSFKDIKFKAEIDSLHDGLSSLISSANLTISSTMLKYVKSHYNIWRQTVNLTKYKPDCKKFFLNLFLSIVNTGSENKSSHHDHIWQNLINRMATIIGDEPSEEDVNLNYYLPPSSGLRMKYRTVGLT